MCVCVCVCNVLLCSSFSQLQWNCKFFNKGSSAANGPLVQEGCLKPETMAALITFQAHLNHSSTLKSAVQCSFDSYCSYLDMKLNDSRVRAPQVSCTLILKVNSRWQKENTFAWVKENSNKVIILVVSAKYNPHCASFVMLTQSGIIGQPRYWISQHCRSSRAPLNLSISHVYRCRFELSIARSLPKFSLQLSVHDSRKSFFFSFFWGGSNEY